METRKNILLEEKERFTDLHYVDNQIFVYDNELKSKRFGEKSVRDVLVLRQELEKYR